MRRRIFEIIEVAADGDRASMIYDSAMLCVIVASLVPLAFKTSNVVFDLIDQVATAIFIFDYALRLVTADFKLRRGRRSFFLYSVTPMASLM